MISGYVVPIVSGVQLTHQGSSDTVISGDGEIVGVGTWGEYFEATFTLIPSGASNAEGLTAATIPQLGSLVTITAADSIQAGTLTVIGVGGLINTTTDATRWIYLGGGSLSLTSTGQASLSLPLKRYPSISMSNTVLPS
jgi:hypothetical protein